MNTGLFPVNRNPASTYANKRRQRPRTIRQSPRKRKAPPSPVRDAVAELLSENLELPAIAEQLGITLKAARRHLESIRQRLGPQAV